MPAARYEVRVDDGRKMVPLRLATDPKGNPLYQSHLLAPVHITVYAQGEEARYASLIPDVGSAFAQTDLSGGMGKKVEVPRTDAQFTRYYYGEWFDASVQGQGQKGPAVTTLTAPANSGALSGYFELAGTPYLVLGRRIASWASDSLTAQYDFGVGVAGAQATTFLKLGTEGAIEAGSASTASSHSIGTSDTRLAQSFRIDDSNPRFLSKITCHLMLVGTPGGDARLSIQADLNGAPSGQTITSSRVLATSIPTTAGGSDITFRFDDDDSTLIPYNVPLWMVLDMAGATASNTLAWFHESGTSAYVRGAAAQSTDGGNSWVTNFGASEDFYWTLYAKTATNTAFVGVSTDGQFFVTSSSGSSYTADTYRFGAHFAVVGDTLVRSVQTHAAGESGAIEQSTDGTNWTGEGIPVGDPSIPITNMVTLGDVLIVCKEDGVYAVDVLSTPLDVQPLYGGNRVSTNGVGACFWRGAVYIPFNGRLMAVEGDFTNGFTVHESVGLECLPEWDWPWGAGRHVACVGTRYHLYSCVSTSGGYRLLKAANPLRTNSDGTANPDWHGSLATIGDGSQSIAMMAYYDPGGTSSPQLFVTTTSNNVARIQLPRSYNPASDTSYPYDTSTDADLYFARAHGNYPIHPKAWLTESTAFLAKTPNDYIEMLWDTLDGEGWRRIQGGRLYDTGAFLYPIGLSSNVLARRLRLHNSLSTASPILLAYAAGYAVSHIAGAALREITFTVVAESGITAGDLSETLGATASAERALLSATAAGAGTRRLEDPFGNIYQRVKFLDAQDVTSQTTRDSDGRSLIQVSAVAIG